MFLHGAIGAGSILLGSFLNYVYHFAMVRLLTPSDYGSLGLLIGLFVISMAPMQTIQRVLAREIARLDKQGKGEEISYVIRKYSRLIFLLGVIVGVSVFILSYFISAIYGEPRLRLPIQVIGVCLPFWYFVSALRGLLQGRERIVPLGLTFVIEPVIKLVFGVLFVLLGFGLLGAFIPINVAAFVLAPFILLACRKMFGNPRSFKLSLKSSILRILLTDLLLMAFLYLDLFFVKYYLNPDAAGYYNVAAITARVLFFAVWGIMLAFFPKTSKLSVGEDAGKIRSLILKSILLITPIFLVFTLFSHQVITVFFTSDYVPSVAPFRILSVGMFLFAVFNILLNLLWAQNRENLPLALSLVVVALHAGLLTFLVPAYGLVGAAVGTCISSALFLFASVFGILRRFI